jgi:hypothetical protein
VIKYTSFIYKNYSQILIRYSEQFLQKLHIRSNKRQARQLRRMTSVIRDGDLITSYAAVVPISFFIALFSCNFAHGQQEDDTTSIPAIGAIPTPLLTPLSPPTPPSTDNIAQKQEQIIGSDSPVPTPTPTPSLSPSLFIEEDPEDRQRFQPQEEQTSEPQLTTEQEQRQQQLTVDEILKDPTGQAAELIEEEKEGTELEIKQRLDEIGGEDGDREGSQRGGGREEQNNREEDNTNSDTINDGEAPLDLQLPIPFP